MVIKMTKSILSQSLKSYRSSAFTNWRSQPQVEVMKMPAARVALAVPHEAHSNRVDEAPGGEAVASRRGTVCVPTSSVEAVPGACRPGQGSHHIHTSPIPPELGPTGHGDYPRAWRSTRWKPRVFYLYI